MCRKTVILLSRRFIFDCNKKKTPKTIIYEPQIYCSGQGTPVRDLFREGLNILLHSISHYIIMPIVTFSLYLSHRNNYQLHNRSPQIQL